MKRLGLALLLLSASARADTTHCFTFTLLEDRHTFTQGPEDWFFTEASFSGPAEVEISVVFDADKLKASSFSPPFELEIVENPGPGETNYWKRHAQLAKKYGWTEFHPLIQVPDGDHVLDFKLEQMGTGPKGLVVLRYGTVRICK